MLQKEIQKRSLTIENLGFQMVSGQIHITPKNESLLQISLSTMLAINERERANQEEAFRKQLWIRELLAEK